MNVVGVVAESIAGETRVAATPETVAKLIGLGYEVSVESGAGEQASFTDEAYAEAGATIGQTAKVWHSNIVFKVNAPTTAEIDQLADGATLVSLISPALNPDLVDALAQRPITVLAMDAVPRISRAQSLDVLSSMANIGGYRAVIEAANVFGRFFTGQITAAGKVPPAKVLVAGVGVAGLAAIGTANSLGAIVRATDPRAEVADQVASIGGEYIKVDVETEQSSDGYAKATSEAYDRRAAEIYSEQAADVDIIITTALIPGRPAPKLITAQDVASMKPGSVIVDMAASQGGNVAGTRPGEVVLPTQASQLYGTNLVNLMKLLTPGKDGELILDFDDVVQRGITVVRDGEKTWPPPEIKVSAAPAAAAKEPAEPKPEKQPLSSARKFGIVGVGSLILFLVTAYAPEPIPQHFTVLILAIVIGYYVIGKVNHSLHTPLMSVTNAISGIIVVGAMLQVTQDDTVIRTLSFVAILLASINVFGGFAVTRRMLGMFSKG